MTYRVLLGAGLQMLQQLTGANFFFYYGTTIFDSVGISDSFVTATILGAVNFVCTFGGLWVVENVGRRKALIIGGFWMFCMFMVFASVNMISHPTFDILLIVPSLHRSATSSSNRTEKHTLLVQ